MTPAPEATRPSAWLAFRQSVIHFDTTQMNPWLGMRNALGVALPLFAGVALHSLSSGVGAALGAQYVAIERASVEPGVSAEPAPTATTSEISPPLAALTASGSPR